MVVITNFPFADWCPQSDPKGCSQFEFPRRHFASHFQDLAANVWPKAETALKFAKRVPQSVANFGIGTPGKKPAFSGQSSEQRPALHR
jgi:hypothetical protein